MPRLIVIGGGVGGLSAAHRAMSRHPELDVLVLEGSARIGGAIATEITDGFVIDRGPEAAITNKGGLMELVDELDLRRSLTQTNPNNRGAYFVQDNGLKRVPSGTSIAGTADLRALRKSRLLSFTGSMRASLEPFVSVKLDGEDESVATFVIRRYGREFYDRIAQPMASGIYGGRAESLSMQATLERFVQLEQRSGSVTKGLAFEQSNDSNTASEGARYGLFVNFDRGMQVLIDALAERLRDRIQTNTRVTKLDRVRDHWHVNTENGESFSADYVAVALGATQASALLGDSMPDVAKVLRGVSHGSAAIVTLAYRRDHIEHPLDAYGFVVASREASPILASTWSSQKWPSRAPDGFVLLRVFVGNETHKHLFTASDSALVDIAHGGLASLVHIKSAPLFSRVDRFIDAMPRYTLGHQKRSNALQEHLRHLPNFSLSTIAFGGVGIPDAIRNARGAVDRMLR
ncbi:MAG: protoporphyrinogen oxidase [Polyangiales bacterium]